MERIRLEDKFDPEDRFWEQPGKYVLVKNEHSVFRYSVMSADNRQYVIIEDNELAAVAVERMLALGFPVYETWEAYHAAVPLKPRPTEFKPWW